MANSAKSPAPIGPDATYAAYLAQGRFMLQRCGACDRFVFFPRVMCPHCGNLQLHWAEASGNATVYSVTIVRRKAQYGGDYNVVLVDLDEGPRMMSRIERTAPDAIHIGMRVRARIASGLTGAGEERFVVFVPVDEAT